MINKIYGNENEVGEGIQKSGVKRESFWLTSKLWNNSHAPHAVQAALDKTLKDLGTDYLDLYLIHWPVAFKTGEEKFPKDANGLTIVDPIPITDTWKAMEGLVTSGKVRNIGISNFNKQEIEEILQMASIKPAVHQMELHPYLAQFEFVKWNHDHGIHVTAYSPFGNRNATYPKGKEVVQVLECPTIVDIANRHGVSAAEVVCAWHIARDVSCVPKSVDAGRIKSNLGAIRVVLTDGDLEAINGLDKKMRFNDPSGSFNRKFYAGLDGSD